MRFVAMAICGLCFLGSLPANLSANEVPAPPGPAWLQLGDDVVTQNRGAIRAFVPTGSQSNKCLLTLGEFNAPLFSPTGFLGAWATACAPRQLNGQNGVLISIFPGAPFPTGLYVSLTVWHEGARRYGTPVFFCSVDNPNC
jgi:hypothetical protein